MGLSWRTVANIGTGGLYGAGEKLLQGDWKGALGNNLTYGGSGVAEDVYESGKDVWRRVKEGVDAPYEHAKEGYDVILDRLGGLKQERLKRKDDLYQRANGQYDDTRNAMAAVYGDPSKWRL